MGPSCVHACPSAVAVRRRPALTTPAALIGSQVSYHHGNHADPEERDCPTARADIRDVQIVSSFVRDHFPDLKPEPAVMESCMYTVRGLGSLAGPPHHSTEGKKERDLALARPDCLTPAIVFDFKQTSSFLWVGSPLPEKGLLEIIPILLH